MNNNTVVRECFGNTKEFQITEKEQNEVSNSIFVDEEGNGIIKCKTLPSIYSFILQHLNSSIKEYATKVGYTIQPVPKRTGQWSRLGGIYSDLSHVSHIPAFFQSKAGEFVFFMDHAVHNLIQKDGFEKVVNMPGIKDLFPGEHISVELFYKRGGNAYIDEQILMHYREKLQKIYESGNYEGINFYTDYRESPILNSIHFPATLNFEPRKFQQKFINNSFDYFIDNFEKNPEVPSNYLLSAPTRSGKSFMGASLSLEIIDYLTKNIKKNNLILVVSGIADVGTEWQETYESHKKFNQKDKDGNGFTKIAYITRNELMIDGADAIRKAYANGAENVVVFLTLQDLNGSFSGSKNKDFIAHDFLKPDENGNSPVDFMIVDEAHFAAFNQYGEYRRMIAKTEFQENKDSADDLREISEKEFTNISNKFKSIIPTVGTLFVSATPYNEIIGGNTFSVQKNNMTIISKQDIQKEAIDWTVENPDAEEYDSPYYGIPEIYNFAVDTGGNITEIFETDKSGDFVKEESANCLIWNFFGYAYNNKKLFPEIVSDPVYIDAGLGNHIIVTVASCASADAVEKSLKNLQEKISDFKYKVMNISSGDASHYYRSKSAYDIKREISDCEKNNQKTIVITVDRLTTGVTVKEWDTVVFWRNMSSAQKFDQFKGRNGTPYVVSMKDDEGNIIKRIEKQNAAVISYAPEQMLSITYQTAITMAMVKKDEGNLESLKSIIEKELDVSPTYMLNNKKDERIISGGDHMVKINAVNILESVLQSQKDSGTRELAEKVELDFNGILNNKELLNNIDQIDENKTSLSVKFEAFENEEIPDGMCQYRKGCTKSPVNTLEGFTQYSGLFCKDHLKEKLAIDKLKNDFIDNKENTKNAIEEGFSDKELEDANKSIEKEIKSRTNRIRNYISIILMFVALSDQDENGIDDVINELEDNSNINALRIAKNLGIDVDFVKSLRENGVFNYTLDTQIYLANETLKSVNKESSINDKWASLNILIKGFGNFSNNEIPTPDPVAVMLVDKLGLTKDDYDRFNKDGVRVIDNGCKSAVMLVEFAKRALDNGVDISKLNLFSVPTSPATYELIRKVYELMGWNIDNIYFIDGVSNLDMNMMLELSIELKIGCQRDNKDNCLFHGNSEIAKKERIRLNAVSKFPVVKKMSKIEKDLEIQIFAEKTAKSIISNIFDKIICIDKRFEAKDFWEKLVSDIEKFDYCISNPPYQDDKNSPIFQHFQDSANIIAESSTMIYMASRWWYGTSGLADFKERMLTNKKLKEVIYFNEIESSKNIFDGTGIAGGVSIVTFSNNHNDTFSLVENMTNQTISLQHKNIYIPIKASFVEIANKILKNNESLSGKTIFDRDESIVNQIGLTGEQLKNLNPIEIDEEYHNNDDSKVKVYANISGTKGGRSSFYLINKNYDFNEINNYKVCIGQSLIENENRPLRILSFDKDTYFGRSAASLAYFNNKEQSQNFVKYASTKFFEFCLRLSLSGRMKTFAYYVPDLVDYSDSNKLIDWNKPIDEQLYKLFNLREKEIEQIENSVS